MEEDSGMKKATAYEEMEMDFKRREESWLIRKGNREDQYWKKVQNPRKWKLKNRMKF